jgi:hypothetical protein
MHRALLLILLLACAKRDVSSGEWTGVARPDAAVSTAGPGREGGDLAKGVDAAPPQATPDATAGGVGVAAPDGGTPPRGPEPPPGALDPMAPRDAGDDVGDARSCPESGPCD